MKYFLQLGCAGFFFLLQLTAAAQVADIPVVHTWGDLLDAKPITLMPHPSWRQGAKFSPVTFHIGISGKQASSHGGLLLYFLADGNRDGLDMVESPERFGLYRLVVTGPRNLLTLQDAEKVLMVDPKSATKDGHTFYAETIPFREGSGDYVVKLVKPDAPNAPAKPADIIAQMTVKVEDHPESLWYPFGEDENAYDSAAREQLSKENDENSYDIGPVIPATGGAALPKTPHPRWYPQLPARDKSLPCLIPAENTPHQPHLELVHNQLHLKLDQEIVTDFPEDDFLTRWWINGKPVELDPNQMSAQKARARLAMQSGKIKEAIFDLHFAPKSLGAKRGDKISVQLLFCPNGWQESGEMEMAKMAQAEMPSMEVPQLPPETFSQISNRIDFNYSGDPKHPHP